MLFISFINMSVEHEMETIPPTENSTSVSSNTKFKFSDDELSHSSSESSGDEWKNTKSTRKLKILPKNTLRKKLKDRTEILKKGFDMAILKSDSKNSYTTCGPQTDTTCIPRTDTTCIPQADTTRIPQADTTCVPETDTTCTPQADTTTTEPKSEPVNEREEKKEQTIESKDENIPVINCVLSQNCISPIMTTTTISSPPTIRINPLYQTPTRQSPTCTEVRTPRGRSRTPRGQCRTPRGRCRTIRGRGQTPSSTSRPRSPDVILIEEGSTDFLREEQQLVTKSPRLIDSIANISSNGTVIRNGLNTVTITPRKKSPEDRPVQRKLFRNEVEGVIGAREEDGVSKYVVNLANGTYLPLSQLQVTKLREQNNGTLPSKLRIPVPSDVAASIEPRILLED